MAYANSVTLLDMEGGAWPAVTARLWMLWTVLGTGSGSGPQRLEQGADSPATANTFGFSFALGPDFSSAGKGIGVSLQDSGGVAYDAGWWFRSGRFDAALPGAPIEVVLLAPIDATRADFAAALPALPLAMAPARTITFLSVISGSMLVATAAGTTTEMLGARVSFSCRVEFALLPSANLEAPTAELLQLAFPAQAIVTFDAAPGDLAGAAAAAALAALPGVRDDYANFVRSSILPGFVSRLETRITQLVLASLAGTVASGATALPAGVVLSARTLTVTGTGVTVRTALGAFGGVFAKFPPSPPAPAPAPGGCFIATAVTSTGAWEVAALRRFRDTVLLRSRAGAWWIACYEQLSPPLAEQLRRRPLWRASVRCLLVWPAALCARLVIAASSAGAGRRDAQTPERE